MDDRDLTRMINGLVEGVQAYARGEDPGLVTAYAEVQGQRAQRLSAAHRALVADVGEDHPAVRALAARAAAAERTHVEARDLAARAHSAPKVRPHELVVSGEVVDREGRPLPGVRVRLYDRDVRLDDLLGDEWTDADGTFHMVFHERDYYEPGEGEPELYVTVHAHDGTKLANTREQAAPESGVPSFMRVQLSKVRAEDVRPPQGVSARQCTAETAKGTRCKRPARPGSLRCALHDKPAEQARPSKPPAR